MVSEARKQSMAWVETDYSKHTYFRWKVKWLTGAFGHARNYGQDVPSNFMSKAPSKRVKHRPTLLDETMLDDVLRGGQTSPTMLDDVL